MWIRKKPLLPNETEQKDKQQSTKHTHKALAYYAFIINLMNEASIDYCSITWWLIVNE
jgi:hypothetical protein